jgi:preprotein translocase subunit SecG
MHLLIVFLSIVLVLICAFLILLILVQLPKKEAGAGLAFGAGATDALFGAGSGNALTKMTKYAASGFLALVLVLAFLAQQSARSRSRGIDAELDKLTASTPAASIVVPGATNQSAGVTLNPDGVTRTTNGNQVITVTPVPTPTETAPTTEATPAPATPVP